MGDLSKIFVKFAPGQCPVGRIGHFWPLKEDFKAILEAGRPICCPAWCLEAQSDYSTTASDAWPVSFTQMF